ncbi:mannose-1-phosphate guanylyltransferase [soil metagenome]
MTTPPDTSQGASAPAILPDTYALVLAGGSGTRFWPLSRDTRPKQLLQLFGEATLLQQTVSRLSGLLPAENIIVLTNAVQEAGVRAALPQLPHANILAEPAKRDTAPAIALGIGWVAARSPSARMLVLPADHLIQDVAGYQRVLRGALHLATHSDALVTIGIRPTWACPSYGYIERGERFVDSPGLDPAIEAYQVKRFREKPSAELAEQFLAQGGFTWNAGMFIWSIPTVMDQLARHCPELAAFAEEVRQGGDLGATLARAFPQLAPISVDYALMERADRVVNVEATFDWDDVGSWNSVGKYLPADADGNTTNCETTVVDSENNIVFSHEGAHIGLVGVRGLIVVQTGDALLIADQDQADKIKLLVEKLPKNLL